MTNLFVRDPRIDPEPGDGVSRTFPTALAGVMLREVTRAHGGFVFFAQDNGYEARNRIVTLQQWRTWAKSAQVFRAAGVDIPESIERCRQEIREYQRAHAAAPPAKQAADAEIHKLGLTDWTIEELLIMQEHETRTI